MAKNQSGVLTPEQISAGIHARMAILAQEIEDRQGEYVKLKNVLEVFTGSAPNPRSKNSLSGNALSIYNFIKTNPGVNGTRVAEFAGSKGLSNSERVCILQYHLKKKGHVRTEGVAKGTKYYAVGN